MIDPKALTDADIHKLQALKAPSHLLRKRCDPTGQPLTGVYEDNKLMIRQYFVDGICYFVANKAWVDSVAADKPEIARLKWGTYPDIPPRS